MDSAESIHDYLPDSAINALNVSGNGSQWDETGQSDDTREPDSTRPEATTPPHPPFFIRVQVRYQCSCGQHTSLGAESSFRIKNNSWPTANKEEMRSFFEIEDEETTLYDKRGRVAFADYDGLRSKTGKMFLEVKRSNEGRKASLIECLDKTPFRVYEEEDPDRNEWDETGGERRAKAAEKVKGRYGLIPDEIHQRAAAAMRQMR